ncbi:MAG: YggS family pyridoxal phosphate-dependent enzyme [Rhodocyclaceae bacterium]|nr:YggS family pyridoxal phosphate-dependent enzyme [Rhodocyclaceae bacterium]
MLAPVLSSADPTHPVLAVRAALDAAARAAGRDPADVTLVAVSKTFPADTVRAAHAAGQRHFGENYVQEGCAKIDALSDLQGAVWHFIGPLQSNKSRMVAERFDWVHSIDRESIARRLADQRPAGKAPLRVCIQVNVSHEDSKSGVAPEEVLPLARAVAAMPALELRGLMAIPAPADDAAAQRAPFAALRRVRDGLAAAGIDLPDLSMGMSADYAAAVQEGATLVRIGSAIFGARPARGAGASDEPSSPVAAPQAGEAAA